MLTKRIQIHQLLSIHPKLLQQMNKQIFENLEIINPHSFKNPICQETFDSLPKIYGSIKAKITHNKLHFYQQLEKRSKHKLRYLDSQSGSIQKNASLKRKEKSKQQLEGAPLQRSSSKLKKSKVEVKNQFSDKFHKLTKQKKMKQKSKERVTATDRESHHKVKFNVLHFLPGIRSFNKDREKPETLSQLIEDKIAQSVDLSNPLVHLYKNKKQSKLNFSGQIKEEKEDESYRELQTEKYVPKSIQRSMKINNQQINPSLILNKSRMKTEPSKDRDFNSTSKSRGAMTEFSKRLLNETFRSPEQKMKSSSTKFHIPSKEQFKTFIQNYKPMSPGFNFTKVIEAHTFQIINYDNAVYFGEFDNVKHGEGVLITEDFVFEGVFQKDQKNRGVEITYDGLYIGKFVNGLRDGKGKFEWNNGEEYRGDWKEGKKHGFGTWKSPNGDYYEGEWFKGRQQGNGVHHHRSSTYKGQFLGSLKHGNGEETFANGDSYKGMYQNGRPHGRGRYDWRDGSYYEGQFNEGYRQGKGQLRQQNGTFYTVGYLSKGSFKRDFKHGFGQQIEKSGEKYNGLFSEGVRVYNSSIKR